MLAWCLYCFRNIWKKKDIDKLYLAVSKDNYGAISAYKKIGFSITGEKLFVRALRHNIPYYVL